MDDIRGARILLVEDHEINQQVAREVLEQAGFVVVLANDGREAVEAVKRTRYDAVLMDIQMPLMDGHEAARTIRAWESSDGAQPTPIIAMTAQAMAGDIENSHAAGMNAHVTKPIDMGELFKALVTWITPHPGIGRHAPPTSAVPPAADRGSLPAALPGIDIGNGLARVGGNVRIYRDLLGRFTASSGEAAITTRRLLDEGDTEAAGRLVHSLKGVAGNLGAVRLHDAAALAEKAVRHGTDAERSSALTALMLPLREVVEGLARLNDGSASRQAAADEITAAAVSRLPETVRNQFRIAAVNADMERLLELVDDVAGSDAALARALRVLVDEFAYERVTALMGA